MASLTDPLIRQLLCGRHVASFATHNPDASIHMVAVGTGSMALTSLWPRLRAAVKLEICRQIREHR